MIINNYWMSLSIIILKNDEDWSSSALSAWVDNSLLDLHNFLDDAQRYPIIDNYNEINKDDDNNTIMMMMMITIK